MNNKKNSKKLNKRLPLYIFSLMLNLYRINMNAIKYYIVVNILELIVKYIKYESYYIKLLKVQYWNIFYKNIV